MKERQLQDAFEAWLRKLDIPFIRSRMDKATTIRKGWPDFSIFWMGHCLFIETKIGKGKPSKDQVKVIAEIRRSGNRAVIAYSIEECIEAAKTILCVGKDLSDVRGLQATLPSAGDLECKLSSASSERSGAGVGATDSTSRSLPKNKAETAPPAQNLFIGRLHGTEYVFKGDGKPGGECEMVRRATSSDLLDSAIKSLATVLILLTSCASQPSYDAQGNGTRLGDRLERWAIHEVNHEHY